MAQASLAYINDRAAEALLEPPETRTELVSIAGFQVEVPSASESSNRADFRGDTEALLEYLAKFDIKPLAILPARWWDHMVQRARLLVLPAKTDGTLSLYVTDTARHLHSLVIPALVMLALPLAAVIWSGLYLAFGPPPAPFLDVAMSLIAGGVAAFLLFISERVRGFFFKSALALAELLHEPGWLTRMLVEGPTENVRDFGSHRSRQRVRYSLPKPPADVAAVLVKMRKAVSNYSNTSYGESVDRFNGRSFTMLVATAPEALAFDQKPRRLVADHWSESVSERVRNEIDSFADPIIYVQCGRAVAVLAQFGEFPIEQAVVEEAIQMSL